MNNKEYEYEVAFSFLKEDEAIAYKINDLIQDRFKTFIYSKNQEQIAGTDGEKTFNRVFGSDSRLVVVLYRENWGQTSWTRIEETAIHNRAYDDGYDFVIFIPLEKGIILPKWLPKTQIYVGYERWGLGGTASAIEARVQQVGGESHLETVTEKAQRKKRELVYREEKEIYLKSLDAVRDANSEVRKLLKLVESLAIEVNNESDLSINIDRVSEYELDVYSKSYCVSLDWHQPFSNTIDESKLIIQQLSGPPIRTPGSFHIYPEKFSSTDCFFNVDPRMKPIWIVGKKYNQQYTVGLSEFCLNLILDHIAN